MDEAKLLERLGALCGIVSEYRDIWGRPHRVAESTKRALLAAMGCRVGSAGELKAEIAGREARSWSRTLPPVLVVREPAREIQVPLAVPERLLGERHVARLESEEGGRFEQPFVPGHAATGERQAVDGERRARSVLTLRAPRPGYHRLSVEAGGAASAPMLLIVAPPRCHLPAGLEGEGRVWGPAVQLYALRSGRNWGIGDFGDLASLVRIGRDAGAGVVGVNPLHLLFPHNAAHASPYSPSSRAFLNPLYLDVEAVPEFAECEQARAAALSPEFRARLVALRETELVDYAAVANVKREVLERLHDSFRRRHLAADTDRARAFRAFQRERGELLESYGRFEALGEEARRADPAAWGWPVWPERWRRPDTAEVARFAAERRERVEYHQYLQWLCDEQLGAVGRGCLEARMAVGIYADLAVGADRAGFEAWRHQDALAADVGLGAPPDDFNLLGQNWGLPPLIPERLRVAAYAPFIECLRANMRHAGALRIDHVMGLMRSFWVPPGRPGSEGAYVLYPFADLLGVLALESARARCLVVGEDLGTVPPEVRAAMEREGILSYRLLLFMKGEGAEFLPPDEYPRQALVAASTHDLPTLAGWWRGRDLAVRARLGLLPEGRRHEEQLVARSEDRARLLFALRRAGLLPRGVEVDLDAFPEMTPELSAAIHRYLARSPSMLLTAQLEDLLGQVDQANLPGTTDEHPNWRRKLGADLAALEREGHLLRLGRALRRERGERARPVGEAPREAVAAPRATYRLQLGGTMTFAAAARLVPYLARLGVSHLYVSPLLQARPGSPHGYDIIDHGRVNPEIGSPEELERLVDELRRHEMGLVLDHVPNHMGVGSDNAWWMSVLDHGPASPFAGFFDIDWRPQKDELRGKLLLPVLEDHFGTVLEAGLLRLRFHPEHGELDVAYHEHRFPIEPRSYPLVLGLGLERLACRLGEEGTALAELRNLVSAFGKLPPADEPEDERRAERLRDAAVLRARLGRLIGRCPEVGQFLAENVALLNGTPGQRRSYDRLAAVLDAQPYRLAYWRVAAEEINYRRFFDVNDLAGLRVEDPRAFDAAHVLLLDLVRRGRVDGLRIDHPDGLHDPAQYFRRLRRAVEEAAAPDAPRPWIVAEKILAPHERLPEDWPIDGTTGYDFLAACGGLFVDAGAARALDRVYHRFLGRRADLERTILESKRLILDTALSSELTVLSNSLARICEADRRKRDFTRQRLRQVLSELIACFPVYRTYIGEAGVTAEDRRHVEWAVARAKNAGRAVDRTVYDHVRDVLLLEVPAARDPAARGEILAFVRRFQQTTGPVMAKGLEDTTFYLHNRLLALNEVGSEPGRPGTSVAAFHRANAERARRWPHTMLCTSTHDTKRSEDVRSRIAAISELPERWERAVTRWAALHRRHKGPVGGQLAPSRNDEYALYQTLLGVWPDAPPDGPELVSLRERVKAAMLKAAREAKLRTSWIHPEPAYEAALATFVDAVLAGGGEGAFFDEFLPLQRLAARIGMLSGLSQLLLKLTSPGVPDIYEGCEGWRLALVDPDSRRKVDFGALERGLGEIEDLVAGSDEALAQHAAALLDDLPSGRIKTFVTLQVLRARRELDEVYRGGAYEPLRVHGPRGKHVCAYARRGPRALAITVAPRLFGSLCDLGAGELPVGDAVWSGTWIEGRKRFAGKTLRNTLTGERVEFEIRDGKPALDATRALARFPLALLVYRG